MNKRAVCGSAPRAHLESPRTFREKVEFILRRRCVEGGALILPVRNELIQRTRLKDVAREDVTAHFSGLFHNANGYLFAFRRCLLF